MQDFWLVMGTLASDDRLHDAIVAAAPQFKRLGLSFKWPDEAPGVAPAAGEYLQDSTTHLRDVLNDFFRTNYPSFAVPVSLYAAAKLCQFYNSSPTEGTSGPVSFPDALKKQRERFAEACTTNQPEISKGFLTLLGLGLIDREARQRIFEGDFSWSSGNVYFTPDGAQRNVLRSMVAPLLSAAADPGLELLNNEGWNPTCREGFFFYLNFARQVA